MSTFLVPLFGGPPFGGPPDGGGPPWAGAHPGFHPGLVSGPFHLIGAVMFFLTLLLVVGLVVAAKRGRLGPPPWIARAHSPEHGARQILAERFANGDISSDEFLERASVLNWTPGAEPAPYGSSSYGTGGKKRKR